MQALCLKGLDSLGQVEGVMLQCFFGGEKKKKKKGFYF